MRPIDACTLTPGRTIEVWLVVRNGRRTRAAGNAARAETRAVEVVARAQAEAARVLAEAERRARGIIEDARAAADGVRAEGMELVSALRGVSDSLRASAERLEDELEAVHARMVGELEGVRPGVRTTEREREPSSSQPSMGPGSRQPPSSTCRTSSSTARRFSVRGHRRTYVRIWPRRQRSRSGTGNRARTRRRRGVAVAETDDWRAGGGDLGQLNGGASPLAMW